MPLLHSKANHFYLEKSTQLYVGGALLHDPNIVPDIYHTMNANIEMLRERAPYAYLIANEPLEPLRRDWQKSTDRESAEPFEGIQLRRGCWFGDPEWDPERTEFVQTAILSVGRGDVFPYIPVVYDDFHQILCLPTLETLETIDEIVYTSASTTEALRTLLTNGGFVVSCLDFLAFKIRTLDVGYRAILSGGISGMPVPEA